MFDDVIYDMSSPSEVHQTISAELTTIFNIYIKSREGACRVFLAPFDVKLTDVPLNLVQPDLMLYVAEIN